MSLKRTVNQQYLHICNMVKGGPVNQRLEYFAPVSATETGTIYQGSLVSLNEYGEFTLGLTSTGAMPMWSKKNMSDPDVITGSNTATSIVGGKITAYVATGGFELLTSEYEGTDFAANAYLTAGTEDGKIAVTTDAPYGTTAIVGVVSRGTSTDQYGVGRLAFWPVFLPGAPAGE